MTGVNTNSRPEPRVGLFVDYENIRYGLTDGYDADREDLSLCKRILEVGERYGRVVFANAYGDWTIAPKLAREFRAHQILPKLVLSDGRAEPHPDISMSLDALETILEGPELDIYLLASGDRDFLELASRLRRSNRMVVVCALESNIHEALKSAANEFVSLEGLLGLTVGEPVHKMDFSMYDWAPLIQLVDGLQHEMPVISLSWLTKKKLSQDNAGCETSQQKQQVVDRAVEEGIFELYKTDHGSGSGEHVTALKLSREHPLVKEFVGI